jgi:spermidine synthase
MTRNPASPRNQVPRGALAALVLSGAAGLIDQVAWIRRSSLVFGSTSHALSTVLVVFFLGLALGGWVFGRRAGRTRQPLRLLSGLELALAVLVVGTIFAFDAVEGLYGRAYRAAGGDAAWLWAARGGLIGLVLLPPAILMGGTLPLFVRAFVREGATMGAAIARLYALNTAGAAGGCLLAGYLLVPALGLRRSLVLAAGLNLAAAVLFRSASVRAPAPVRDEAAAPAARPGIETPFAVRWAVTSMVFLGGLIALAQEVVWARFLAAVVGHGVHTVSLTLALVLAGIVLGSALASRIADRPRARLLAFVLLPVVGAVLLRALVHLPPTWWRGWGSETATASILVLPSAILAGASFPLAVRLVTATPAWAGLRVGTMLAWSTLGGIVGALLAGFVLLPGRGLASTVAQVSFLGISAAGATWSVLEPGRRWRQAAVLLAGGLAWAAIPHVTGTRVPDDLLAEPSRRVAVLEGLESNLAVVRGPTGELQLEIDRWWQGQDRRTHQVMAAHLPMLLHPAPRRVLLVGVGAGQTPASFVLHDSLEALDTVDIEPRVFDVVRRHFPHAWMDDPRVRLLTTDGRNHLAHAAERYDVISLEVGQLFRPGAASFYTRDFYERARARLRPGGIVSQFVPLPFLEAAELKSVVATFLAVFPQAGLWYNTSELLLVGSADAPVRLDAGRIARALADPAVAADLRFSLYGGPDRWNARPEVLHGAFLAGPRGLAALARGGRIARDDRPRLAYDVTVPRAGERRELAGLDLLRRHLDPVAGGEAARVREDNLREIVASAHLRGVEEARAANDRAGMTAALRQAVAAHPGNLRAQRMLGDALLLQGQYEESARHYQAALAISADDARTHGGLGLWHLVQQRFPQSVEHYRRALALGGDDAEWRNNLGAGLVRLGDLPAAVEQFRRAVELKPDDADARRNYEATRAVVEQRGAATSPFGAVRQR